MASSSATVFAFLAIVLFFPQLKADEIGNSLSPLLSPYFDDDDVCKEVQCGKGTCRPSSNKTLPLFSCECEPGWRQARTKTDSHFGFLPCVIPNCTLDYSCSQVPPPTLRKGNPTNFSIFDPCNWAYCGGGSCSKASNLSYTCNCNDGFDNLMNINSLPCLSECAIGMDCTRVGVTMSNSSTSTRRGRAEGDTSQDDDDVCKEVQCGKGTCRPSSNKTLPFFSCECEPGWRQARTKTDSHFGFLPCVIPNCTLDYSCSQVPPPTERKVNPANFSIFDPCNWAYCGGGSCSKTSNLSYTCNCNEGFDNLMNITSLPCLSECTIGMDCTRLGVTMSNSSTSTTRSRAEGDTSLASSALGGSLFWVILLMMPLAII